ncbi:MAG: DUF1800 domain-containing protein [Bacteroidetes bacterium]|nr:DUF1800 domain-containing protein [Bacteroidota bacterium]
MGNVNRREFFEELVASQQATPKNAEDEVYKKYANKTMPTGLGKTTSSLTPYTGAWTKTEVIHLLRRTTFGVKYADIQTLLGMTMTQAVDKLLNVSTTPPAPPVNNYNGSYADPTVPLGQTWVNAPYDSGTSGYRMYSLKSWWLGLMINQDLSILEKMTLFWHNHFSTEVFTMDARYSYRMCALLRANALGNFKSLVRKVTTEPAMLIYLNGYLNTKTAPDENYARELQELFTLGKGYTPIYSEDDVKAAAKVLTGWRINGTTLTGYFDSTKHDTTNKIFSSFYNGSIITGKTGTAGANEIDDLMTMIFSKNEAALYICRRLYRYFVYYSIDATTEANIIAPLASILVSNNFEIKPVMDTLLKSQHFYDMNNQGCYIRTPMDYLVGMFRTFNINIPTSFTVDKTYAVWNYIRSYGASLSLDLGDPPNVSGWPAFYQEPDYYEIWINSNTLPKRLTFSDMMLNSGFSAGTGTPIKIDVIAFADAYPNAWDPNLLIDYTVDLLFGIQMQASTKTSLKIGTLLTGQTSDYYWSNAWNAYKANPNTTNTNTVKTRLTSMLTELTRLAEHQLC